MKSTYLPLLAIALLFTVHSCTTSRAVTDPEERKALLHAYQTEITEDFLQEHLYVFAGEEMQGRGSGTASIARAADYLANFNQSIGLKPVGDDGSFFQHFDMEATYLDGYEFRSYSTTPDTVLNWSASYVQNSSSDVMIAFGGQNSAKGEIIFAGFGIVDADKNIDHLTHDRIDGNWVMVFENLTHIVDGDTLFRMSYNERERLIETLFRRGASGMILISDQDYDDFTQAAILESQKFESPVRLGLPYLPARQGFQGTVLSIRAEKAATFLGLDSVPELWNIHNNVLANLTDFSPQPTGYYFVSEPKLREKIIQEKNVAALLEGAHPERKEEIIVLSAHYDHMGIGSPDAHGDVIYNGADDNGSGSIALLNIAKAFAEARDNGIRPDRSILFLHVAVEEWGLLGSRYYSDHPIFPMEQTVANINVDMMGRRDREHEERDDRDFVYIIGAEIISSDLNRMLQIGNEKSASIRLDMRYNDLTDRNQFYRRSDHWNFGRFRVPFIFFFSGVHPDYHQPGDTPDKILYDSLMKRSRVIFSTTVEIANTPERPRVDNEEFIRITETQSR